MIRQFISKQQQLEIKEADRVFRARVFSKIATFDCKDCNYKWIAPNGRLCPKCWSDKVDISEYRDLED